MFIAVLSAFFMGDETLQVKFGIFSRGAGNENVMTMLMIYILAGAFSAVAAAMGGRDAESEGSGRLCGRHYVLGLNPSMISVPRLQRHGLRAVG